VRTLCMPKPSGQAFNNDISEAPRSTVYAECRIVAVRPSVQYSRCNAVQNIPDVQLKFECWQCKQASCPVLPPLIRWRLRVVAMGRFSALLIVPVAVFLASCGMFHSKSAPAGTGQEVLDGKFAFIVNQVATSRTFGQTRAQGDYVIVSLAIRNVGTEAQVFEMAAQRLKDSAGHQYSASFMDPPSLADANNINPGLQVSVKLAFDLQPGARPTQIVLHDSASSHGASVNLKHPPAPAPTGSATSPAGAAN
jgi:Domain of unknown function (DUF4352)